MGFHDGSVIKNLPADAGDGRDESSILGSGRFPWRRKWQPTPVFSPGKSHGQRSLVGYSPGVVKSWTRLIMHKQAANNKQEGLAGCSFRPLSSVQSLSRVWLSATPGLQHARLLCPSPTPGACSNSGPLSRWCHPTISSSAVPFSSHLQSFPASGSFPMSQFFASGGQSIEVSAKYWSFSFRSLSSLLCTSPHQIVKDREAWHAVVHRVAKSWTCLSDFTTTPPQKSHTHPSYRPSDSQA